MLEILDAGLLGYLAAACAGALAGVGVAAMCSAARCADCAMAAAEDLEAPPAPAPLAGDPAPPREDPSRQAREELARRLEGRMPPPPGWGRVIAFGPERGEENR